jgi:DNA (cytosine-5)-methyltransferase 1
MIKVGSDFSGVGAFNQALIKLGKPYKEVFACDMDKYARQTFIENYGEPEYFPTNVYNREIPIESLDIYMTSPPCQAFSLAGKRLGKEDKRGILFFNSHEFIQVNKPRFFIFENVKGLLSDNGGKTFSEWVAILGGKSVNGNAILFPYEESVPYHLYWKVLNAKEHGVPQNRERVFLIGIRDDSDNKFQFPKEEHLTKRLKDVLEENVEEKYFLSEKMVNGFTKHNENHNEKGTGFIFKPKDEDDIANCLRANAAICPTDNTIKIELCKYGFHTCGNFKYDLCDTCDDGDNYEYLQNNNTYGIRRLTPRECFRLMDFPDSFIWTCSDSQAYKQAGNSIVVNVIYKILKQLPL